MAKKYRFYGGPADGGEVPHYAVDMDYVLLTSDDITGQKTGSTILYYYEKCDDHPWFEYAGEVEEQEDEDNE